MSVVVMTLISIDLFKVTASAKNRLTSTCKWMG